MPTDRRARLCCEDCGVELDDATADRNLLAAWTYCDECLERLLAALPELNRQQHTPAFTGRMRAQAIHNREYRRAEKRARRLAIARRRQRIATQPRVGDTLVMPDGVRIVVTRRDEAAGTFGISGVPQTYRVLSWRELVRYARVTQEAA